METRTSHIGTGLVLDSAGSPLLVRVELHGVERNSTLLVDRALTTRDGRFTMELAFAYLRELFGDVRPRLFFRLFAGTQFLASTEDSVVWTPGEGPSEFRIVVDRDRRRPSRGAPKPAPLVARGTVHDVRGRALSRHVVAVFDRNLRGDRLLGKDTTDARGAFRLEYPSSALGRVEKAKADLVVTVSSPRGKEVLETEPWFGAPTIAIFRLGPEGEGLKPLSGFDRLVARLNPALEGLDLARVTPEQASYLVATAERAREREDVGQLVEAHRLAAEAKIEPEVAWALVRSGVATETSKSLRERTRDWEQAIRSAMSEGTISKATDSAIAASMASLRKRALSKALGSPDLRAVPALGSLLSTARGADGAPLLSRAVQERVLDEWEKHEGTAGEFWQKLAKVPAIGEKRLPVLQRTLALSALTGGHVPLVAALQKRFAGASALETPRNLVSLREDDWLELLAEKADGKPVGVPAFIEGKNATERRTSYARELVRTIEDAFPTPALAERIKREPALAHSDIGAIFDENPELELSSTGVDAYLKEHPNALAKTSDPVFAKTRLLGVERMFRISSRFDELRPLFEDGIHSAAGARRLGKARFMRRYANRVGSRETAEGLWDRIGWNTSAADLLVSELHPRLNRPFLHVLPSPLAGASDDDIADLRSVFGDLDACACEHCVSVYSPAAYLVDLLEFLDRYEAKRVVTWFPSHNLFRDASSGSGPVLSPEAAKHFGALQDKLGAVSSALGYALSELQPKAVALGPALAKPALDTIRAAGLEGPSASALEKELGELGKLAGNVQALAPDFSRAPVRPQTAKDVLLKRRPDIARLELSCENTHTPLPHVDLVNEILEHALTGTPLPDRIRTTLSAEELAAAPEIIAPVVHRAAYEALGELAAPWTLPFDLWDEEARIWLAHLGTSRAELIKRFPEQGSESDRRRAAVLDRLRLPQSSTAILDDMAGHELWNYWGFSETSEPAGWVQALEHVPRFLERSGLTYESLAELLKTKLLSHKPPLAIVSADPKKAPFTCEVADLRVRPLTTNLLGRIHRFLRIRRALGWSIGELDKAVTALGATALDTVALERLEAVGRLRAELGRPLPEILAWFAPIDTEPGVDGGPSQYERVFQNRRLGHVSEALSLSNLDGSPLLPDHAAAMQAALRIGADDLSLLTSETTSQERLHRPAEVPDPALDLASLSALYRVVSLAKALRFKLSELLTLLTLTGENPFDPADLDASLRFIERAKALGSSGLPGALVDYVVRGIEATGDARLERDRVDGLLAELDAGIARLVEESAKGPDPTQALPPEEFLFVRSEGFVVERVAAMLRIDEQVVRFLLAHGLRSVADPVRPALDDFLGPLGPVPGDPSGRRDALVRLHKAGVLFERLGFTATELVFLHEQGMLLDLNTLPLAPVPTAEQRFVELERLRRLAELRNRFRGGRRVFFDVLGMIAGKLGADGLPLAEGAPRLDEPAVLAALAEQTGWSKEDLDFLAGPEGFAFSFPGDWLHGNALHLSSACLELARRLGTSAEELTTWAIPAPDAAMRERIAAATRAAARSRHDEESWAKIARPLRDPLRERQRDALIAAVCGKLELASPTELFERYLIDVEMDPCRMTSRIRQAISAIQAFVQRCFLNLEAGVELPDDAAREWEWRKNYRIWEANRKVFFHPENWIYSELRDDKSPFFRELESELLQGEMTEARTEGAIVHYLEKVEAVSGLEIAALYHQREGTGAERVDVLHVFGRGRGVPRGFWYRRREKGTRWTPWESIPLDIEGEHLIPVIYNRRLRLLWPLIVRNDPKEPTAIRLAWSDYQHGSWTPKKTSMEAKVTTRFAGGDPHGIDLRFRARVDKEELVVECIADARNARISVPVPGSGEWAGPGGGLVESPPSWLAGTEPDTSGSYGGIGARAVAGVGMIAPLVVSAWKGLPVGEFRFSGCGGGIRAKSEARFGDKLELAQPRWTDPRGDSFVLPERREGVALALPVGLEPTNGGVEHVQIFGKTGNGAFTIVPDRSRETFFAGVPFVFFDDRYALLAYQPPRFVTGTNIQHDTAAELLTAERSAPRVGGPRSSGIVAAGLVADVAWGQGLLSGSRSPHELSFELLSHPCVCDFLRRVNARGVDGLYAWGEDPIQLAFEGLLASDYRPEPSAVRPPLPIRDVDFSWRGANSLYNWEIFFHAPLWIADRLIAQQRFDDAFHWLHRLFDPTEGSRRPAPARFWKVRPFYEALGGTSAWGAAQKLLLVQASPDPVGVAELSAQIHAWEDDPFNPHLIARMRPLAYQKAVAIKYVEARIARADQIFRLDTLEALDEATQIYLLVAEILGPRPNEIPSRAVVTPKTYAELEPHLDELSNAAVAVENYVPPRHVRWRARPKSDYVGPLIPRTSYFCFPANDRLLGFWDTLADRLFKIRNCMDIEGRVRQLPLFEPPIDPALLVRARAAGVDLSAVLAGLYAPLPLRRFELLLRRAQDLAAEVRALGGELLAALEKRDNERLSLLRSDHEIVLLDKVREAKRTAIDEARETSASLQHALAAAELKFDYYEKISREGELPGEKEAENQAKIAGNFEIVGSVLESVAGVLKAIPQIQVGPDGPKTEIGGVQFGGTVEAIGQTFSLRASVAKLESASLERKASWDRRDDEWEHQLTLARAEVAQVTKQIAAADLKQALAERELESHDLQREQSREVRSFLREKFTDEELHGWMTSELATVHFQAYQLAYEAARRAEAAFRFELGLTSTDYVSFGYWDDLRKGLLAGEKLALDLRRLESAWIERDRRDYELTRHVSLVLHDPSALIELKATGHCTIDLPETFFDADYPNHYFRRIKNVTVTIPCVTGPHTPINCTLTLEKSRVRADVTGATADNHAEQPPFGDSRFLYDLTPTRSIATSGAQNDSGMFELSFRDERYLPFEGAGAISTWKLELPPENNAIDLDTITDVVLRIDYTAREGGELLRGAANAHLEKLRTQSPEDEGTEGVVPLRPRLQRLFSLRHEFPDAWHAFLQPLDPTALRTLDLALTAERFPYLFRGRSLQAHRIDLVLVRPPGVEHPPLLELEVVDPDDASAAVELVAPQAPQRFAIATFSLDVPATGRWRIRTTPGTDVARLTRSTVSDLLLRVEYFLLPAP